MKDFLKKEIDVRELEKNGGSSFMFPLSRNNFGIVRYGIYDIILLNSWLGQL